MNLRKFNRLVSGLLAGLTSGLLVLFIISAVYLIQGISPGSSFQIFASPLIGEAAFMQNLDGGFNWSTAALGGFLFLIVTSLLGGAFGLLTRNRPVGELIIWGVLYGAVLISAYQWIAIPNGYWVSVSVRTPDWVEIAITLGFGVSLALIFPFEQMLKRRELMEITQRSLDRAAEVVTPDSTSAAEVEIIYSSAIPFEQTIEPGEVERKLG